MAAQTWLGEKYVLKCTAEVHSADKTRTGTIETRTDIEWRLETPADANLDQPKEIRPVAVMEYKRKHLIDPKQLLNARYYQSEDPHQFKEDVPTFEGTTTYFADTAFWLIKQVKSYQTRRKVRDVCLFDWDTIFILNFEDGFDPDAQGSSEEDKDRGKSPQGVPAPKNDADIDKLWPAGILYQEQAKSSERAAAEYTFRSLLFAFLIRALKRVKEPSVPKEPFVPITYDKSRMLNPLTSPRC